MPSLCEILLTSLDFVFQRVGSTLRSLTPSGQKSLCWAQEHLCPEAVWHRAEGKAIFLLVQSWPTLVFLQSWSTSLFIDAAGESWAGIQTSLSPNLMFILYHTSAIILDFQQFSSRILIYFSCPDIAQSLRGTKVQKTWPSQTVIAQKIIRRIIQVITDAPKISAVSFQRNETAFLLIIS